MHTPITRILGVEGADEKIAGGAGAERERNPQARGGMTSYNPRNIFERISKLKMPEITV
jgi:hypothetical protein